MSGSFGILLSLSDPFSISESMRVFQRVFLRVSEFHRERESVLQSFALTFVVKDIIVFNMFSCFHRASVLVNFEENHATDMTRQYCRSLKCSYHVPLSLSIVKANTVNSLSAILISCIPAFSGLLLLVPWRQC